MGNITQICNEVTDVKNNISDANLDDYKTNKMYEIVENLTDQKYNHEIVQLLSNQQIKKTLEGHKLWRNLNGEIYLGQFTGDKKIGKGVLYKPGKYFYYGQIDQVPNGEGQIKIYQEDIFYHGHFTKGRLQGKCRINKSDNSIVFNGTLNHNGFASDGKLSINDHQNPSNSCDIILNNYPENDAEVTYNDGKFYKGQINLTSFVPHGKGQAIYPNNTKYSGHWILGQFHGDGKFTWADDSWYQGSYVNGKKQGKGTFQYPSKKVYIGDWYGGKQQGEGTLYSNKNSILKKGIWKNGKFIKQ